MNQKCNKTVLWAGGTENGFIKKICRCMQVGLRGYTQKHATEASSSNLAVTPPK